MAHLQNNDNTKRILFVDDEPSITTVIKMGLERHGFSVEIFNDPNEALSKFKPGYYDIIMLDIRMPGMDGLHLARLIWEADPHARICFLTAFEIYENEAKKVFPHFKTHCFIKKPVSLSYLAKHIESHFVTQ